MQLAQGERGGLERVHGGLGADLVLLTRAAPDSASTLNDAVPDDRYRALAGDHATIVGGDDASDVGWSARSISCTLARPNAVEAVALPWDP